LCDHPERHDRRENPNPNPIRVENETRERRGEGLISKRREGAACADEWMVWDERMRVEGEALSIWSGLDGGGFGLSSLSRTWKNRQIVSETTDL
jgi:hypothetical protein